METLRSDYIKHYDRFLPEMLQTEQSASYIRQVYDYLELMKPGTILNLQADKELDCDTDGWSRYESRA